MAKLTRALEKFHWGTEQQNAFDRVKRELLKDATLSFFDTNLRVAIVTNELFAVFVKNV